MNKSLLTFLIVILSFAGVFAQEEEENDVKEIILTEQGSEFSIDRNTNPEQKSHMKLDRETNRNNNQTVIKQNGEDNVIISYIDGFRNLNIVEQNGRGNYVEKYVEGEDLILETSQNGNYNYILQNVSGKNGEFRLQQEGINNELIYSDKESPGMNIKMQGSDMKLKIIVK